MMSDEPSETESSPWQTPATILYRQIDRFLFMRSAGRGGADALQGCLSIARTLPDLDGFFEGAMKDVRDSGGNEWDVFEAILALLKRSNLWLQPPRALVRGEELLGAIK